MHHERFGGLLEGLDGLALPAQGIAVDGKKGEADFADLLFLRQRRASHWVMVVWGLTRREKGSLRRRRSVERW